MSLYSDTPSSSFEQIVRGFCTGFRWFVRLLVTAAVVLIAGVYLYKEGKGEAGESGDAVTTHHDIRHQIALGVGGKVRPPTSKGPSVVEWKPLTALVGSAGDPVGMDSEVEILRHRETISYQVMIGPYDPDVSRDLKKSSGWVNLRVMQANGLPVPGMEQGVKIPLSSFEFHQKEGLPVGWIYRGSLGPDRLPEGSQIRSFSLGWVIPSNASVQRPVHAGLR